MFQYTEELTRRAQLIAKWMLGHIREDGSLDCSDNLGTYYKLVYPLRSTGYTAQASKVLTYTLKRFMTPSGDFRTNTQRKASEAYNSRFCQTYAQGWITLGAELLGRRDTVCLLHDALIRNYFDEELGAIRAAIDPELNWFDSNSAAAGILSLLLTDLPRAERLADFLIRLMDLQPDPEHYFYHNVTADLKPVATPDPKYPHMSFITNGQEGQIGWVLGLPSAALIKLYEATGKERYLEYGIRYFDAFVGIGDGIFRSFGSGKGMWAASMLYRLTGASRYLEICTEILEFFFSCQAPDGSYHAAVDYSDPENEDYLIEFDITPEYCRWFLEVAAELNH